MEGYDDESSNLYDHLPASRKLVGIQEKLDLNRVIKDNKDLFSEYIEAHRVYSEKRLAINEELLQRGVEDPAYVLEYVEYNDDAIQEFVKPKTKKIGSISDTYRKYTGNKYLLADIIFRICILVGILVIIYRLVMKLTSKN